jgi:hypothetical protein
MTDSNGWDGASDVPENLMPADASDSAQVNDALDAAFDQDWAQVGNTDVSNFAESGFTDSNQVGEYIAQNIPAEHLDGLDGIQYVNDSGSYQAGLMGQWQSDFWSGETTIEIYPHTSSGELYDTIAHEIGHNAQSVILQQNTGLIDKWNDIYGASVADYEASGGEQNEFVTPYARTNAEEDFAESYACFINDPSLLQAASPVKYDYMAENILS